MHVYEFTPDCETPVNVFPFFCCCFVALRPWVNKRAGIEIVLTKPNIRALEQSSYPFARRPYASPGRETHPHSAGAQHGVDTLANNKPGRTRSNQQ